MENENKVVALSQKNLLLKVNSSIGITNKLIAENNKKLVVEIFERNPKFFIGLISNFYPLTLEILSYEKYLNWQKISIYNDITNLLKNSNIVDFNSIESLNWEYLSGNKNIEWSTQIINIYIEKWNWNLLSYNENIPFNEELIDKFTDRWRWYSFNTNYNFPWSFELVEKHEDKLDFESTYTCSNIPLSINLLEKYQKTWNEHHWSMISCCNKFITWNEVFLFKDYFSWEYLSENESLIWTLELIEQYEDKWNWSYLSKNKKLPWSLELLEKYEELWNWNNISNNEGIEWTEELIERFDDKLLFDSILNEDEIYKAELYGDSICGLSSNKNVRLSEKLIEKYINRWNWSKLSENKNLPWSVDFFEKHIERWDWNNLSGNNNLPFTEVIISTYEERWTWIENTERSFYDDYCYDLSSNEHLPWSESFIDKYAERWNWINLFYNKGINWSVKLLHKHSDKLVCSYYDTPSPIWNELKQYIDDELVIKLLEDIKNGKIPLNV
ncbi:hypothetical protein [Flavobacterium cellulosilyticum]|uniref:Tryptophan repeat gene family protein n=1 Tax=Flavobacterium cellulosilyticum TaxID=2541731 RepID=A0A4R5C5H1_9FLAO|nr:hypothetical protein [Flavobacterium cellulosilyticum]TDD93736.1 hypothetical protein E0F76_18455 [Flavobacterium cellulosilyticum]